MDDAIIGSHRDRRTNRRTPLSTSSSGTGLPRLEDRAYRPAARLNRRRVTSTPYGAAQTVRVQHPRPTRVRSRSNFGQSWFGGLLSRLGDCSLVCNPAHDVPGYGGRSPRLQTVHTPSTRVGIIRRTPDERIDRSAVGSSGVESWSRVLSHVMLKSFFQIINVVIRYCCFNNLSRKTLSHVCDHQTKMSVRLPRRRLPSERHDYASSKKTPSPPDQNVSDSLTPVLTTSTGTTVYSTETGSSAPRTVPMNRKTSS